VSRESRCVFKVSLVQTTDNYHPIVSSSSQVHAASAGGCLLAGGLEKLHKHPTIPKYVRVSALAQTTS